MLRFLAVASFFLRCWSSSDIVTFLLVGDWGGNDLPPYTTPAEMETASSMGKTAERLSSSFQISLGDNFYHRGVKNVSDPRFRETFEASCTFDRIYNTRYHAIFTCISHLTERFRCTIVAIDVARYTGKSRSSR